MKRQSSAIPLHPSIDSSSSDSSSDGSDDEVIADVGNNFGSDDDVKVYMPLSISMFVLYGI